ncbi:MAG: hypothetical protein IBX64_12995 [Actinobacteria bacterium]|nr:hypothetical protein [Actinomycetota bacterium]
MGDETYYPLLSNSEVEAKCLEEDYAWWLPYSNQCAIFGIVTALQKIARESKRD